MKKLLAAADQPAQAKQVRLEEIWWVIDAKGQENVTVLDGSRQSSLKLAMKEAAASLGQCFNINNGQGQAQQEHWRRGAECPLACSEVHWMGVMTHQKDKSKRINTKTEIANQAATKPSHEAKDVA